MSSAPGHTDHETNETGMCRNPIKSTNTNQGSKIFHGKCSIWQNGEDPTKLELNQYSWLMPRAMDIQIGETVKPGEPPGNSSPAD